MAACDNWFPSIFMRHPIKTEFQSRCDWPQSNINEAIVKEQLFKEMTQMTQMTVMTSRQETVSCKGRRPGPTHRPNLTILHPPNQNGLITASLQRRPTKWLPRVRERKSFHYRGQCMLPPDAAVNPTEEHFTHDSWWVAMASIGGRRSAEDYSPQTSLAAL